MNDLGRYLQPLYRKHADRLCEEIASYARTIPRCEPTYPNPLWYKHLSLYFIYPDGVATGSGPPLARLIPHLAHRRRIGCDSLHILPFLASPLVDAGLDVSDYLRVRPDLGSIEDLRKLVHEAQRLGIRRFMDLVANHVSDQHRWFQKAQAGDARYRDYFIVRKSRPEYVGTFHKESAVWARYIVDGRPRDVNVAFPELAGEIPHWRQGADAYWYYHTYYPQQLDLNWHNPDVFLEFAKIVLFWSSFGFSFRLDAIPFVGKLAYKRTDEEYAYTYQLTAALRCVARSINPECVFIVETYEKIPVIAGYFGDANDKRADLAYNFHLCTFLWVALVTEDASYIWRKLDEVRHLPVHGAWMNFLRNHDELSLAYLKDPQLSAVRNAIGRYGETFREGYGISGRTYSLLGSNERRFLNAYFLLASLPGSILIPYGDELGRKNIPLSRLPPHLRSDTRNINRGTLTVKDFDSAKERRILDKISELLHKRAALSEYVNVWPTRVPSPPGVFAARYRCGTSELLAFVNLTDQVQSVTLDRWRDYRPVLRLRAPTCAEERVTLGPYAAIWLQK